MEKRHRKTPVPMNMSRNIKEDLLPKLRARYARRGRDGRSRLLDDLCEDYGYERKYAIKLLRDTVPAASGRRHSGPERQYDIVEPVVRTVWLAAEQPCGKRLAPALPLWARHYERHHGKLSARQRLTDCWRRRGPSIRCAAVAAPSQAVCSKQRFRFGPGLGT
jgi:hypothetical protein